MDNVLYNILAGFLSFFLGYLFGSIPFGIIIGKTVYKADPREAGSKNAGGTNVGRLYGKRAGVAVIALDMLKGIVPLLIAWAVFTFSGIKDLFKANDGALWNEGRLHIYLAPLGAAIGHCWPLFAHFRGGKAVSSLLGFGLIASWFLAAGGIIVFFMTLKARKHVSLASLLTTIVTMLLAWLAFALSFVLPPSLNSLFMWGWGFFLPGGWEFALIFTLMSLLLIVRHRTNIDRLKKGEERTIKWMG